MLSGEKRMVQKISDILIWCILVIPGLLWAEEGKRPESLIYYDKPGATVLVTDKSECTVNVYRFHQTWKKSGQFACSSGKQAGDKYLEGDEKTPTGVYWLTNAWTGQELLDQYGKSASIYGIGAIELNYPNYLDEVFYRKGGYGIWLHGTDKPELKATRGCISTSNEDLVEISQFIKVGDTPMIIEEKVNYVPEAQVDQLGQKVLKVVEEWRQAWQSTDQEKYLSFYSKRFKTPEFHYAEWVSFKNRVNQKNKKRQILIEDISIFKSKDLYTVHFTQHYSSSRINDIGKKEIFLVEENGRLKILSEHWEKLQSPSSTPSFQYAYKGKPENAL